MKVVTLFPGKSLEAVSAVSQTRALIGAIQAVNCSLVLTAGYSHLPMLFAVLAARKSGACSVVMFDSNRFDHARKKIREVMKSYSLKVFHGGLIAGKHSGEYLAELGMDTACMELACDVVDNDEVSAQVSMAKRDASMEPCFLFVGRFVDKKNVPALLSAYARYRSSCEDRMPLPLVLCGSGPLEQELRKQVRLSNIEGVQFAGYVTHPEIYSYYARAHALILPSKNDQWGLVVNEALAAGVPVLVSHNCGCVPELVHDGVTGWTFPPTDIAGLSEMLQRVHKLTPVQREGMRIGCKEAIQDFGLPRFTDGIERLAGRLTAIGPYAPPVIERVPKNSPRKR
ncbi:glycosyltransferase [Psychromarinibacter sp. C21-152]|uniref:Glycosyltransferase n=1 Tax=Psychromarinibacter sediminicola TaxID=3033385 RepID=A0AAE3NX69_9RHOB|nr:glycosyltransferase [Psychromarinibacter sediminicola]MDF0603616.1 glycosyltransferase [Psychromarinibacter sediminicola]